MTSRLDLKISGEPSESHEKAIRAALTKYLLEDSAEITTAGRASWILLKPDDDSEGETQGRTSPWEDAGRAFG